MTKEEENLQSLLDDELKELQSELAGPKFNPDKDKSHFIGKFFFHQIGIENLLLELILEIEPRLQAFTDDKKRSLYFIDKVFLLRSLVDSDEKLQIFDCLLKLNDCRKDLAHRHPSAETIKSQPMRSDLKKTIHNFNDTRSQNADKLIATLEELAKCAEVLHIYMACLCRIEKVGKEKDQIVSLFQTIKDISDRKLAKRVAILFESVQSGVSPSDLWEKTKVKL